jgi:hypothetical protein
MLFHDRTPVRPSATLGHDDDCALRWSAAAS